MFGGEEQKDVRENISISLLEDMLVKDSESLNSPLILSVRSGHAAEPGQVWVQRLLRVRTAPQSCLFQLPFISDSLLSAALRSSSIKTCHIPLVVASSDHVCLSYEPGSAALIVHLQVSLQSSLSLPFSIPLALKHPLRTKILLLMLKVSCRRIGAFPDTNHQ